MEQERIVRKWGNTWVICLTPTDAKDRKLENGKSYKTDISEIIIKPKKKKNSKEKVGDKK